MTPFPDEIDSWISRELGAQLEPVAGLASSPRYLSTRMAPKRQRRPGLVVAFAAACFLLTGGMVAASASVGGPPAPAGVHAR